MTREEFKSCFDQYFESIRNYIYYRSGNVELAQDIGQEVFLKLWEKQLNPSEHNLKGLLYKMASDRMISEFRKNKVADQYLETINFKIDKVDPQASLQYAELKDLYESSLAALPENQRTVFLMSRMEGLTYKEIAERLALSTKAVEKRMSKALAELKQKMRNYHEA